MGRVFSQTDERSMIFFRKNSALLFPFHQRNFCSNAAAAVFKFKSNGLIFEFPTYADTFIKEDF